MGRSTGNSARTLVGWAVQRLRPARRHLDGHIAVVGAQHLHVRSCGGRASCLACACQEPRWLDLLEQSPAATEMCPSEEIQQLAYWHPSCRVPASKQRHQAKRASSLTRSGRRVHHQRLASTPPNGTRPPGTVGDPAGHSCVVAAKSLGDTNSKQTRRGRAVQPPRPALVALCD